jgi:outer membrane protein TolC
MAVCLASIAENLTGLKLLGIGKKRTKPIIKLFARDNKPSFFPHYFLKWIQTAGCSMLLVFLHLFFYVSSAAQDTTAKVLSQQDFLNLVLKFHPVAKQAAIVAQQGRAELTVARGAFDPTIGSDYLRKTFDGTNYYSLFESELKIPVWWGEVKAGYDYYYGSLINPENKIPKEGQTYLGISLPLLRDVITDRRRTALRQARLFRDASEQQRILMLNDLLFDAVVAYNDWLFAFNAVKVFENAVQLAEDRLVFTRKSVEFGDRAAIDTVEALTQLQLRQYELNDAKTTLQNSILYLSNFLWTEKEDPLIISNDIQPEKINKDLFDQPLSLLQAEEMASQVGTQHPLVLFYNFKLQQVKAERLLKGQNLLPRLNASYHLLSREFDFYRNPEFTAMRNNYKLGVTFSMPISFAQSRGEFKLAQLKVKDAQYTLDLKRLELTNKLKSYFNELINYQAQVKLTAEMLNNYRRLLVGEEQRFRAGESSLFVVNARENKVIETELKLFEQQVKFLKTEAAVKWSAGSLYSPIGN